MWLATVLSWIKDLIILTYLLDQSNFVKQQQRVRGKNAKVTMDESEIHWINLKCNVIELTIQMAYQNFHKQ